MVQFTDSMNAALVSALVAAGLRPEEVVGETAEPWTFGMEAYSRPGRKRRVHSVVLSSPSKRFAEAANRINPADISVTSCNGDVINGASARLLTCDDLPPGASEIMIGFISPFLLPVKKDGRTKTRFHEELPISEVPTALKMGLDRRAKRTLDLSIAIDPLSAATDGRRKHLVHIRRFPSGKKMILPGFIVPMTLRGTPEDVRFAYLAGLGAKTRNGNGCPTLMQ
ncbi:CRISPR-associated endoribonuclease Cas6 [Ectothiorhodospira lacustris]|uniref:CRISPR-associated endoribonuclease Cas6 n=1 Tax=Ectothiorhodospira lacustris TaxID=2899127 RepID=UPI001EE84A74|nr:CRISPR-associated endoribonuclease Cas6 [Ectothiorhodospira lacustris]MCG5508765.1 hypothetical protein [Ectothiorhodospira lacustris]MCG5520556.1 hypothetical protein [Ectothiorhodospira lacustris]